MLLMASAGCKACSGYTTKSASVVLQELGVLLRLLNPNDGLKLGTIISSAESVFSHLD